MLNIDFSNMAITVLVVALFLSYAEALVEWADDTYGWDRYKKAFLTGAATLVKWALLSLIAQVCLRVVSAAVTAFVAN